MGIIERIRGQNVLDNVNIKAFHLPQPVLAVTNGGTTDEVLVVLTGNTAFQTDSAGNRVSHAYPYYLASDVAGLTPLVSTVVTGTSRGSTTIGGAVLNETTGNDFRKGVLVTNSTGQLQVILTSTGTSTAYLVVTLPNGRLVVSDAMVWT